MWLLTWTGSNTAHDDLHCLPLTRPAPVLSRRVTAGTHPGSVALTTGTRALLPDRPLWPVAIHCGKTEVQVLLTLIVFGGGKLCLCLILQSIPHLDRAFLGNYVSLHSVLHTDALHWQVRDCYTASASSGTRHHKTHCKDPTLSTLRSLHELVMMIRRKVNYQWKELPFSHFYIHSIQVRKIMVRKEESCP